MTTPWHPRRSAGFTLMELMVVLAIVALLAGVAYPSYVRHVQRAQRAEARAVLLESAQFMERYYAAKNSYTDAALPARLQAVPPGATGAGTRFNVTVSSLDGSYTLTAAPVAADPCGKLTLTQTGSRGREGSGLSLEECWR